MPRWERSLQGETLDALCWRAYGRTAGGVVEAIWAANPRLALLPSILPLGTLVWLPALAPLADPPPIRLWA